MFKKIDASDLVVGDLVFVFKNWFHTPYLTNFIKVKSDKDIKNLAAYKNLYIIISKKKPKLTQYNVKLLKLIFDEIISSGLIKQKTVVSRINAIVSQVIAGEFCHKTCADLIRYESDLFKRSCKLVCLTASFCNYLTLTREKTIEYCNAAFLMDISMAMQPLLLGNDKLVTSCHKRLIEIHPIQSANLASASNVTTSLTTLIIQHHENFNGSGYPFGLKGRQIKLGARILRVLNTYEALTSGRPYKAKLSPYEAINVMQKMAINHVIDPVIFKKLCLFLRLFPKGCCVTDSKGLSYFVKEMHVESGTLITFSKQNKKLDVIQEYSIKKVFL